jgi:hypothetical protein
MILNGSVANGPRATFRGALFFPRLGAALLALCLLVATLSTPVQAEKLPLERLFAAPDVSGPSLRGV